MDKDLIKKLRTRNNELLTENDELMEMYANKEDKIKSLENIRFIAMIILLIGILMFILSWFDALL